MHGVDDIVVQVILVSVDEKRIVSTGCDGNYGCWKGLDKNNVGVVQWHLS
jgi:hypothetical protein